MKTTLMHSRGLRLVAVLSAAVLGACAADTPLTPARQPIAASRAEKTTDVAMDGVFATLRQVTDRYHDLEVAKADSFVFLHGCEVRGEEGPVGTVYINVGRMMDGKIDPSAPDGLVYEPTASGRLRLAAVEFAVPYPLWTGTDAPTFQGATFQREDEFGVYGLHVWLWEQNPEGLFAESNPKVQCGVE